jgi:Right handed beta helix region
MLQSRRLLVGAIASCLLVVLAIGGAVVLEGAGPGSHAQTRIGSSPPSTASLVCGRPILRSPFGYDEAAGTYRSGTTGLPTYGTQGSDFPRDTAGIVLPAGTHNYPSYELKPDTVYYMLPGVHFGSIQADTNDVFVGGFSDGKSTVLDGRYSDPTAIDSNSSNGDQGGVTIEYLTIEKYNPTGDAGAINQETNTGWTIQYNTITLNVPGAGVMVGAENILRDNCLTLNGQYGFQSSDVNGFGKDSLTNGPYDVVIKGNEISYNDTCDFSGLINNKVIGWHNQNPVSAQYRNPACGKVTGDGNEGGFKLWQTNGVTVSNNYIHNNWGPGGWADTDNANTTWVGNTITDNEGAAIVEEVSYNFSIADNYIADNDWTDGLGNSGFPQPAIYISESGSDSAFGGVPACRESVCSGQKSYRRQSIISGNTLVNNGGSIFLWQNSNRYCSDGSDMLCTLVAGGRLGPYTVSACKANLPSASVSTTTYAGHKTGTPLEDWWDGCIWKAENVLITSNTVDFEPSAITDCNESAWPDCGAGGIFSEYGSPSESAREWVVPTQLTFFQNDIWSKNVYHGPSTFFAWNQGNGDNPVNWAAWTGNVSSGGKCGSQGERQSGYCTGPFGQDAGSTYNGS